LVFNLVGEEEYNRQILIREGVPGTAVSVLPRTIVNTEQKVQEVARQMRQTGKSRAIMVTSPQHTRRVRTLWNKLIGDNPDGAVHAAPDADHGGGIRVMPLSSHVKSSVS
jgi:uncharacterized SAM-binding protein YcdF (DUF218 family)